MTWRFIVSPLSEAYFEENMSAGIGQEVGSGSINVTDMAKKVLRPRDYDKWMNRFNSNLTAAEKQEADILETFVKRCIDHQFFVDAYSNMTASQYALYVEQVTLNNAVCDGRFRVWSEHIEGQEPKTWFVTEFKYWMDNTPFWGKLQYLADENGFELHTMVEAPELEKSWRPGSNGFKEGDELCDDNATYGENHGRLFRQVEFRRNVHGMSVDGLKELRGCLKLVTEEVWTQAGVGVS